jgi:GT2 family glycosyltransferase
MIQAVTSASPRPDNVTASPLHDVAVIVVGRNACDYVKGCLQSLREAEWRDVTHQTIYIDNGSTDNTLAMLDGFPEVTVIANPENLGFCKAATQGAVAARSRYLFFINDDTVVLKDAGALLVEYLDSHPEVGSIGSRLLYPDGSEQWSGRRFPSPLNSLLGRRSVLSRIFPNARPLSRYLYKEELSAGEPFPVDWVSAAAQLVRADTFQQAGGYAENYYYWHEAIICDRIRRTGKQVYLHPQSKIIHYEGKGSGSRPYSVRKWHIVNFHKGAYQCYCEHYGIGRLNPLRWLAASFLSARAAILLLANRLTAPGK